MPEEQGIETITNADGEKTIEAGNSSPPDVSSESDEELFSTLDVQPAETDPGEANNTQATADGDEGNDDKGKPNEDEGTPDEDGEETRFDKHPRFQQLLKNERQANERAIRAEERNKVLEETRSTQAEEKVDYNDISEQSIEDLKDAFAEDPKMVLANYARQVKHELTKEFDAKLETDRNAQIAQSKDARINETYSAYAKEHEDFDVMWDSGELQAHMEKNPGHNAISAHQVLTAGKTAGDNKVVIDEAVAKAVKETEARMTKNFLAKGANSVLGEGPSGGADASNDTDEVDLILKNPKQFGGTVMAGVKALEARAKRRAQAGG